MISISYKAKQFLLFIAKISVVGLAFWFIYQKLSDTKWLNWNEFQQVLSEKLTPWSILLILILSFINRFFEILKWKNLAQTIQKTSVYQATKQVLSALVFSLFTPNGLGEYGGKALFFEKSKTKNVIFLNFVCNGVQVIINVCCGLLGLLLLQYYDWAVGVIGVGFLLFLFVFFSRKITIKGYSVEKLIEKINQIPKSIHQKNTLLGLGRYLALWHQQYFIFMMLGVDLPYLTLITTSMSVHFLTSCLPNFQFLDFIVRGGVAVYFFGLLGINEWIVMLVIFLGWMLNTMLPVVIGSFFVMKYKVNFSSKE